VAVSPDLESVLSRADVLVDFAFHEAIPGHVAASAKLGRPFVLGTTGLTGDEATAVRRAAERVAAVWAPNMSLGMNLLFAAVERAAAVCREGYAIEVSETHHVHKKDAPSGTALRLGERVAAGLGRDPGSLMVHVEGDGEPPGGAEGRVVVRSHREGEVVGDHTVTFSSEAERIEFTHHAWSRDAFALGALRAASWVVGQAPGLYGMQDVLGLAGANE
jgi:4-hydroxy-tetrahydrodipicolinate reductase